MKRFTIAEEANFWSRHPRHSLGYIPAWGIVVKDRGRDIILFPLPHESINQSPTRWIMDSLGLTPQSVSDQRYFANLEHLYLFDATGHVPQSIYTSENSLDPNVVRTGQLYESSWSEILKRFIEKSTLKLSIIALLVLLVLIRR